MKKRKIKAPNSLGLISGSNGDGGNVRRIHDTLIELRKAGEDLTLTKAIERGAIKLESGQVLKDITIDKLLHDIGIDRKRDTLSAIVALPEDQRWIVPEIFLEAVELGMRADNAFYQAIVAQSIQRDTPEFQQPQISAPSIADQGLNEGGIATSPDEGVQVVFSSRGVKTTKFQRKLTIPEEVMRFSTLDQLDVFLVRLAKMWGLQLTRRAIDVLINGDAIGGGLAAGTIGVDDSSNGLQWIDLIRIMARAGRLGFQYTTVVSPEEGAVHVLNLPEFKNLQQGRSIGEVNLQGRLPTTWDYFMHSTVGTDNYIFVDPSAALVELVSMGLRVESEKLMNRDLTATYVRIQQGFANLFRDARVVVDQAVDFSGNPWPAWMTPID
jgi:hypothetical protein